METMKILAEQYAAGNLNITPEQFEKLMDELLHVQNIATYYRLEAKR